MAWRATPSILGKNPLSNTTRLAMTTDEHDMARSVELYETDVYRRQSPRKRAEPITRHQKERSVRNGNPSGWKVLLFFDTSDYDAVSCPPHYGTIGHHSANLVHAISRANLQICVNEWSTNGDRTSKSIVSGLPSLRPMVSSRDSSAALTMCTSWLRS